MAVSQHDGSNAVAILFEEVKVWNTNVDAVGRLFREAHAGVKDDHFILIAHSHAIHSKLADAAERNNF